MEKKIEEKKLEEKQKMLEEKRKLEQEKYKSIRNIKILEKKIDLTQAVSFVLSLSIYDFNSYFFSSIEIKNYHHH